MPKLLISYIIVINIVTFFFYGIDKRKAIKHQWRIPEVMLFSVAFIGGSVGALLGMQMFHHKTKHWKFRILIPMILIIHVFFVIFICK